MPRANNLKSFEGRAHLTGRVFALKVLFPVEPSWARQERPDLFLREIHAGVKARERHRLPPTDHLGIIGHGLEQKSQATERQGRSGC